MKLDSLITGLIRKWLAVPSVGQRAGERVDQLRDQDPLSRLYCPIAQANFAPPVKLLVIDIVT